MRESSLETQLKGFISFSNAVPLDCTPSMRPSILKLVPTYCMIPMHNPLSLSGVYRVVMMSSLTFGILSCNFPGASTWHIL